MTGGTRHRRRGFSLVEAAIITVMVALAVPPSVKMLEAASSERSDRVMIGLATTYAGAIMEQVLADVSTHGLDAIAAAGYLNVPIDGLWQRLEWVSASYTTRGLSSAVEVSGLVAWDGQESADASENLFRLVTVRVDFSTARGGMMSVPLSMICAEPHP